MKKVLGTCSAVALLLSTGVASADEVRVRFVERVGNVDIALPNNHLPSDWQPHRVRLQLGIFDSATGPADAGGFIGWVDGVQTNVSLRAFRTPGRLGIYTYGEPGQEGNGTPMEDPFVQLTNIDAVMGPQQLEWRCVKGELPPMPAPVIRGRNTWVSVWEVTVHPGRCNGVIEFSGDAMVAGSWSLVGTPMAPSCDGLPEVTTVTYEAAQVSRIPFAASLTCVLPGPPPSPFPCGADWNADFTVNSSDFFLFVQQFLEVGVDFNCDGVSNTQDFFEYLEAFFEGC